MDYNTLIDLHSYGHDIETSWLIDRGIEIIGMQEKRQGITDGVYKKLYDKLTPITKALAGHVYEEAFNGNSLANECERGVVNTTRVWWVQAETVIGFLNAYEKIRLQMNTGMLHFRSGSSSSHARLTEDQAQSGSGQPTRMARRRRADRLWSRGSVRTTMEECVWKL